MNKVPKEDHLFASIENKYIVDIQTNESATIVKFVMSFSPKGENPECFYYFAEADCCSESWFENFLYDEYMSLPIWAGQLFTLEANYEPKAEKQEYDKILHIVAGGLDSTFGASRTILFDLRNSSNGYYSGWLSFLGGEEDFRNSRWAVDNPGGEKFKSVPGIEGGNGTRVNYEGVGKLIS